MFVIIIIKEAVGGIGLAVIQVGTHAVAQGVLSVFQGEGFRQAFWSGALGSLGASGFQAVAGKFAKSTIGTIAFGALSGGIGAELSDGNFWEGAVIGGVVAGLNHGLHKMSANLESKSIAEKELNAVGVKNINATAPNTQDSLDKVLSTDTLSSMHKDSGKVGITYGKTSQNNYLGETDSKTGKIIINKSKKFSYYKLYATVGHELVHAIDYVKGTANNIFNNYLKYYKGDKAPANVFYREALEFRAYQWEMSHAPSSLSKQWYNYYKTKNGW
ncbi:hypothetical protein [Bergeyella zoohelcum]|uniref:Uncharacterized protein n=1 Tax=Bergeyella zoohelcum TaxID=1015 RepID=A0A376C0H9_9FLAO|nr:hypothetical protein [Bergeyella zoohelcum]EKB60676.1 hypothetical protein HMPREF9700_00171 [Bergeyella zoohelcum CCUG 30536]SSZ47234.1 Uncharacterised protein [Bergeyella zoohelcum]